MNREERMVELIDRVSVLERSLERLQTNFFQVMANMDLLIKNVSGLSHAVHKIELKTRVK